MDRTLLSLAIIKGNWEENKKDYIDNFVPMVASLAIKKNYDEISPNDLNRFRDDFTEEYGLKIPINAFVTIFNRAVKKKIFKKDYGKYLLNSKTKEKHDFSINSSDFKRKFAKVISSIIKFRDDNKYEVEVQDEDIEQALLSFLKDHDLDILFASKDKSVLPNNVKPNKKVKYLISRFIIFAEKEEPDLFQFLLDISVGHALACAILYSKPNSFSGKIRNLNIYLDTPLILSLLGYHDKLQKAAVEEFVKILKEEKVNLFIFDTTRDEIDSILGDCQRWLERGNYDISKASRILRYCHQNNINSSDVELTIVNLDSILQGFDIANRRAVDPNENKEFQIDEIKLKGIIQERYQNNSFYRERNDYSIDRDVKVLSKIYKLRRGDRPRNIKNCKELFVTSNSSLSFASKIYEDSKTNSSFTIPACLTEVFLGTLIWLQSPQKTKNLNMKKFIANCHAAIQPSEELISRYLHEVEKLKDGGQITNDECYLLRTHRASLNLLAKESMGDADAFDDSSIEEILNSMMDEIKREEKEKLNREKEEHQETKNELSKAKETIEKDGLNAENKAEYIANKISWGIFIVLCILAGVLIFLNLKYDNIVIRVGIGIITLLSITTGFNIKWLKLKIRKRIKKGLLN